MKKVPLAYKLLEIEALAMSLKAKTLLQKPIYATDLVHLRTLINTLIDDTCNVAETKIFLAD